MEDSYQEVPYSGPEPKKKMSGWLIALIVVAALVVICCICSVLGFLLLSPTVGSVFSTIIETVEATPPLP